MSDAETRGEVSRGFSEAEIVLMQTLSPDQLALEGLTKKVVEPLIIECGDGKKRMLLLDPPEKGWELID